MTKDFLERYSENVQLFLKEEYGEKVKQKLEDMRKEADFLIDTYGIDVKSIQEMNLELLRDLHADFRVYTRMANEELAREAKQEFYDLLDAYKETLEKKSDTSNAGKGIMVFL